MTASRAAQIQRVFLGLLIANVAVVGAKVVIGIKAGSLSVLGDAIHSSVDALNNVLFILLMRVAGQAPDEEHPYGHGKFEVLGAMGIVIFLSVACFELFKGAITRLVSGAPPPTLTNLDLGLLVFTLALNVWVAWFEAKRGRELSSELLLADSAHTRADVFITMGVIVGGLLARRGLMYVDPVLAIIIALLVARIGYQIVRRGVPILVDERARAPEAIKGAAEGVGGVESAYSIRSRSSAGAVFAELTIGVSGSLAVDRAHAIADEVEVRLKKDLGLDQVTVHIEPC